MGFRFRKSIRLLPGVRLNMSKTGVSASVGRRGMTLNIGRGKAKTTVGIPGTGISYSSTSPTRPVQTFALRASTSEPRRPRGSAFFGLIKFSLCLVALIVSVKVLQATPQALMSWIAPISTMFDDEKAGVLAAIFVPGCLYILWRIISDHRRADRVDSGYVFTETTSAKE